MTICAERTAVVKAVTANTMMGPKMIHRVFVVTDSGDDVPFFPCGGCRSVLAEFSSPTTKVYVSNLDGTKVICSTMGELLPNSFEMAFSAARGQK